MTTSLDWLTAEYEGSGNGAITLSAAVNEGIDRSLTLHLATANGAASTEVMVTQEGMREVFTDYDFMPTDGTFNVLKSGGG